MIFVQLYFDNFWNNHLSLTHTCFHFFSYSFSLYYFIQ